MADQSIRKKHGRNDDESSKSFKKARIEQVNVRYLSRESFSVFDQIRFRERGNVFIRQSWNNIFNIKIGSSLERYIPKDCHGSTIDTKISTEHGAIFNLEFSPNNQYLVAACENKAILLFDPCSQKRIRIIRNAHKDGVNCVTFLDNRTFATCSDDKNISLWDIRNTRSSIFSLRGHTSWVKSINYNTRTKQLVSSAFDDTIRTWNINDFTNSDNIKGNKVMKIPYLTRTKLMCHNECQKLVAATNTGILFVVHNLKFDTLKVDTSDTMRKLKNIDIDCNDFPVMNLDTHKNVSNRIEFITEFANDVDPWCIASIQIHPQMESILSRYGTKGRQNSEWSTIHSFYEAEEGNRLPCYRLQGFVEESNLKPDYIKELCYNNDGKLVCSPFGNGIRLLSGVEQFPEEEKEENNVLKEIKYITSHKNTVLTAKFAPESMLLASGCLDGQVSFYRPKI